MLVLFLDSDKLVSMCGIVAYLGPKSVESVLLVGLTRLEYRGYGLRRDGGINRKRNRAEEIYWQN